MFVKTKLIGDDLINPINWVLRIFCFADIWHREWLLSVYSPFNLPIQLFFYISFVSYISFFIFCIVVYFDVVQLWQVNPWT